MPCAEVAFGATSEGAAYCLEAIRNSRSVRVLGPSGSGKSSISRSVAQTMASAGPVAYVSEVAIWTLAAGDVSEMVLHGGDERSASRLIETFDLSDYLDRPVRELSHGQRQRVALASALTSEARVVVMDEPTRHLDARGEAALVAALREEARSGRARRFCVAEVRGKLPDDLFDEDVRLGSAVSDEPEPTTEELMARLTSMLGESDVLRADGLRLCRPGSAPCFEASWRPGSPWIVSGPAGAGKTTLLRTLAGLMEPSEGKVYWESGGRSGSGGVGARDVGFVGAEPELSFLASTVAEELALGAHRSVPDRDVSSLLSLLVGAEGGRRAGCSPLALSRGGQFFVGLCSALAKRPRLLVLDEPTTGLDSRGLDLLRRLLSAVSEKIVVLAATHEPLLGARFTRRVEMGEAGGSERSKAAAIVDDSAAQGREGLTNERRGAAG